MWIDGHEYTLLRDYDKSKYQHLSFNGKVTYLSARVELILLRPCKSAMSAAAVEDGGTGLILTTGICAMISAASTFLKGTQTSGQDKQAFLEFIGKYMPCLNDTIRSLGITWAEWLYRDVRCGLAHGFTIERGGIENGLNYLEETQHGPEISLSRLLEDFAKGWSNYLADVERDGPNNGLGQLFQRRFDEVFHD